MSLLDRLRQRVESDLDAEIGSTTVVSGGDVASAHRFDLVDGRTVFAKTHPDRWVCNCAYGIYTLPPESIERLEPNVLVCIVGGRRPMNNRPEQDRHGIDDRNVKR